MSLDIVRGLADEYYTSDVAYLPGGDKTGAMGAECDRVADPAI